MYTLGLGDLKSIAKGLLIALIGAGLTYLSSIIPHIQFGVYTPIAVAVWSVLANIVWKLVDGKAQ